MKTVAFVVLALFLAGCVSAPPVVSRVDNPRSVERQLANTGRVIE